MVMKFQMGITHWVQENFKLGVLFLGVSLGFSLSLAPAQAAYRVHLDKPTLDRGYTVALPSDRFSLGIPAGMFTQPLTAALKRPTTAQQVTQLQAMTDGWALEGKIRTYNLTVSQSQILTQPVWVSLRIPVEQATEYFLAYFDGESGVWKVVPSSTNLDDKRVTAALPFTYATVAVFSTPQIGPEQQIDFQSATTTLGPLQAASAIVLDVESGQVLYEKNQNEVRSIASMTKVATTWLALTYTDDWSQLITYTDDWSREGAALHILAGETLSVEDLLYTTLVGSANNTAVGLANAFTDQSSFVTAMNDWVTDLGLTSTYFVEPSGLDAANVSTAYEYALLSREAFKSFSMLQLATTKTYTLHLPETGDHTIHTTDNLLYSDLYLTGGKTGYTEEAGYCLMIQTKNSDGDQIIVVVMGEPSSADRFTETYALAKWAFANYRWN